MPSSANEHFDMLKMQEEALRRAREMQARARPPREPHSGNQKGKKSSAKGDNRGDSRQKSSTSQPSQPSQSPQSNSQTEPAPVESGTFEAPSLFDSLLKDKDKTLIIALLVLLSEDGEKANHELLFALMFLLM